MDVPLRVPLHFRGLLAEPRSWAWKRFVYCWHWVLVDPMGPLSQLLASVPVLVSLCLHNMPKCITASSFLCMTKNYARETDRCLPVCAFDPAQTDRKKWSHAAELTT